MKIKKAIKVLKKHNKWRRYDSDIGESPKMTDPKKLGIAIDTVVNKFEELTKDKTIIALPPDENIINAMGLLADIDYDNQTVWGHDTDLGRPEDVIKEFKNKLIGN